MSEDASPSIRRAQPGDAPALALLGAATMLETYAALVPGPDLVAHCTDRHSVATYATWLADPGIAIWLAETPTQAAIAYLVLMPTTLAYPGRQDSDLEVQRVYVLSRFQGAGVGARLMARAIEAAHLRLAGCVVLGVLKANLVAVAFYRRQGFEVVGGRQFRVGQSVFDDYVMGREIVSDAG